MNKGVQSAANEAELEAQLAELLPRGVPGSGGVGGGITYVGGQGPQAQPTANLSGNGGYRQEIVYENVKSKGSGSQKADDKPPPEKAATDKEKVCTNIVIIIIQSVLYRLMQSYAFYRTKLVNSSCICEVSHFAATALREDTCVWHTYRNLMTVSLLGTRLETGWLWPLILFSFLLVVFTRAREL